MDRTPESIGNRFVSERAGRDALLRVQVGHPHRLLEPKGLRLTPFRHAAGPLQRASH